MKLRVTGIAILTLLLVSVAGFGIASFGDDNQKAYSVFEKAFYLSAEDAVWIRPGLNLNIMNIQIPEDRRPYVTFKITDDGNQPLDRSGIATPGSVSTSWILAYIPQGSAQYVAYTTRYVPPSPISGVSTTQAGTDSGGSYSSLGDGVYGYKFGTALPAGYDTAQTHTLGVYATRNLSEWGLSTYYANELKSWVPNGSPVTKVRDVVSTAACNNCHNSLGLHGGSRKKVEICILCHQPQTIDPDSENTMDMPVLIHRIHRGPELPSVQAGKPYIIYGHNMSVHDYSHTTYPQDLRNCTTCHRDATQADQWFKNPTRATCGESCHDGIDWTTGEGHVAGPQPSDRFCANCHYPEGEVEYDAGIKTAHVPPYRSKQLVNPTMQIQSIVNTGPGLKPTVKFRVLAGDGKPILPSTLTGTAGRLRLTLAGPNTDVNWRLQEAADGAASDGNGWWNYTFTGAIPADAKGSYTLEGEGRVAVTLNPGTPKQTNYNNAWDTVLMPFAVTDSKPVARRQIVESAKCNACHDKLMFHGNSRNGGEICFICHNPTFTARSGSSSAGLPNESVSMQYMIHKIHTGEELEFDYLVGNTSFKEVLYPGDRRDCLQCHKAAPTVPLPAGVTPISVPAGLWTPMGPTAAACLSCHDSIEAGAHAYVNTAPFGESCGACHKESGDFAVSKVHAR